MTGMTLDEIVWGVSEDMKDHKTEVQGRDFQTVLQLEVGKMRKNPQKTGGIPVNDPSRYFFIP